jgi:hypothetical protein
VPSIANTVENTSTKVKRHPTSIINTVYLFVLDMKHGHAIIDQSGKTMTAGFSKRRVSLNK